MAIDYGIDYDSYIQEQMKRAVWKKVWVTLPKVCRLSNKKMWCQYVMQGSRIILGPGTPVIVRYWADPKEFTAWTLQK